MNEGRDYIRQLRSGWWLVRVNGVTQAIEYQTIDEAYYTYREASYVHGAGTFEMRGTHMDDLVKSFER